MDEPTAALNDAEVEVLHDLIRRFVRPDTGVIYISHRIDELRRIADRITVIRDGRYVGTRETQRDDHEGGHRDDGRPRAVGRGQAGRRPGRSRGRARGLRAEHEGPAQGRQLRAAQGRDPRLRRPDGGRPDRGRARDRRRGQGRRRDDPAARPRDPHPQPGRRRAAPDRLPVRGPQAVRPAARAGGQREHRAERAGRALPGVGVRQGQGDARRLHGSTSRRCASRRRRSPRRSRTSPAATSRRSSSPSGSSRTATS